MSRNCKYLSWNGNRATPKVTGAGTGDRAWEVQTQSLKVATHRGFLSDHAAEAFKENEISGERKKPSWMEPFPRTGSRHPAWRKSSTGDDVSRWTFIRPPPNHNIPSASKHPAFQLLSLGEKTLSCADLKSPGFKQKSKLSGHDGNFSFTLTSSLNITAVK